MKCECLVCYDVLEASEESEQAPASTLCSHLICVRCANILFIQAVVARGGDESVIKNVKCPFCNELKVPVNPITVNLGVLTVLQSQTSSQQQQNNNSNEDIRESFVIPQHAKRFLYEGSPMTFSFSDDSDSQITNNSVVNPYLKKPIKVYHHGGLRNPGNSCYINSSLQLLFSLPSFFDTLKKSNEFFSEGQLYKSLMELYDQVAPPSKKGCMTCSATSIKKIMDKLSPRFAGFQQHDAHEFISEFLDSLHEELKKKSKAVLLQKEKTISSLLLQTQMEKEAKAPVSSLIVLPTDTYFCMKIKVCLTCDKCGYSRNREELFRHISLDIDNSKTDSPSNNDINEITVEKALEHYFTPEKRDINCEKCKKGKSATQSLKITKMPRGLLLHLKRFELQPTSHHQNNMNNNGITFRKSFMPVSYPQKLDLTKFLDSSSKPTTAMVQSSGKDYSLRALVNHTGPTLDSGHYTSEGLRLQGNGKQEWMHFDDRIVKHREMSDEATKKNKKDVYMVLYELNNE